MQVLPESHSSSSDSVTSFAQFISELNFGEVLSQEQIQAKKNIVQIGEMRYRVEDKIHSSISSNNLRDSQEEIVVDDSSQFSQSDTDSSELLPNMLHLQLVPMQVEPFLSQLPHHLTSFINELVDIVKIVSKRSDDLSYRFHFKKLDLGILLTQRGDQLSIIIHVGDKMLQEEFTKERQELMTHFLSSKLDMEEIDVEFVFSDFDENSFGENDSDSNNDAMENDQGEANDEESF